MIKFIKYYIMPIIFILICMALGGVYWLYSAPVRVVIQQNPDESIGELVVNAKVVELQDQLSTANRDIDYLRNITPVIIIRPIEDLTKIKILQDQLLLLNQQVSILNKKDQLSTTNDIYNNIIPGTTNPPIYVADPIDLNSTYTKSASKVNILHKVMEHGGSYTYYYEKENSQ